jgi:hypothetical protein
MGEEVGWPVNATSPSLTSVCADPVARLAYHLPRRFYHHFCLWQAARRMGFKVLCIVKLSHHHVWDVRLRTSAKVSDKSVRRLRRELRKLCAAHGPDLKAGELAIVRDGSLLELAFIWRAGEPGHFNWRDLQGVASGASGPAPWN